MVFMCQKDSFLKEYKTKVISCTEAKLETLENGKKIIKEGYDVELRDTILFPEGGGQPCDFGLINDAEVLQVRREGDKAIHFANKPLEVNVEVTEIVNWDRRFDHMQQHSGQHLLSAILDRDYGYNTDSWWLGDKVSYVEAVHIVNNREYRTRLVGRKGEPVAISNIVSEGVGLGLKKVTGRNLRRYIVCSIKAGGPVKRSNLFVLSAKKGFTDYVLDTPTFSKEDIVKTEKVVNDYIKQNLPVVIHEYKADDPALKNASTRGLPDDISGEIRVISIGNIDSNMCCGTHVQNLSQLQVIKILYAEKSSRKNKTNIYFLVGDRVLNKLDEFYQYEASLIKLLNNGSNKHVELIEKLQKNVKDLSKTLKENYKEMITYEVSQIKASNPRVKYYIIERKNSDMDYINNFLRMLNDTETCIFFTCGEEKSANGMMVLYGEANIVAELGPKFCELLNGKGAGKGNRYQAKVTKLANRNKCEDILKAYLEKNC